MKSLLYTTFSIFFFSIVNLCFENVQAQNINRPMIHCPGGIKVNSYTGNMHLSRTDIFIEGRKFDLDITFKYNSKECSKNFGYGNGWSFLHLMKYYADNSGVYIMHGDGRYDFFTRDAQDTTLLIPPAGIFDSLVEYQAGKFVLVTPEKIKYFFNNPNHKRITKTEEPNGNFLHYDYQDSLLNNITDASGRSIQLIYSTYLVNTIPAQMLHIVTDVNDSPTRSIYFNYDSRGNVIEVIDPLAHKTKYNYIVNGPMSAVTDKNDNTVDIIYQSNFAVKEVISCNTEQRFSYNKLSKTTYLVETVASGNQVTFYHFSSEGNLIEKKGNCCGYNVKYEYDNDKNIKGFTDANGHQYTFTYNDKGLVKSQTDPLGNTVNLKYDPVFNKVTSYKDKMGNQYTFDYDNKGNLTNISMPHNISIAYTVISNGDITQVTDGRGISTDLVYDPYGNLKEIHRPLGVDIYMTYDHRSRRTDLTNANGNTTNFTYDIIDRLTNITDPAGHQSIIGYDNNDNITSYKDRNNHETNYTYDAMDRLIGITDALNQSQQRTYDSKRNLLAFTNENGHTTTYTYDHLNRRTSRKNPAGEMTAYDYDGAGNVTSISYPNGNTVNYTYDELNRLTKAIDNICTLFQREYNANNMITSIIDGNNHEIRASYDDLYRLKKITDPLGYDKSYTYDNNNNLLSYTDRNNHVVTAVYDSLNRKRIYQDALNNQTHYGYDPAGNLISITDANSRSTAFAYSNLNRLITETFADSTTHVYGYDPGGNVNSYTDNNGDQTTFVYDELDRMTKRDYPGTNEDEYTYNPVGKMLTASNNNAVVSFTYDNADRIASETLNGLTTVYNYNIAGSTRTMIYPGGRTLNKILDARNRLTAIKDGTGDIALFTYDAAGRVLSKNYPVNGTSTTYGYDAADHLLSINTIPNTIINFTYAYDHEGNKLFERKNHKTDRSEKYYYNDKYELTKTEVGTLSNNNIASPVHSFEYNYDALGNRITAVEDTETTAFTVNSMNGYTAIAGDATINPVYDNNGNVINDGTFTYSYNANNQLKQVNNGSVSTYKYDALGRRVQKTVGSTVTNYLYSGYREIENRDGANNIIASNVYGLWIDDLLSVEKNGVDYFYYANELGSVAAVADNSGNIVDRYDYDPFGKIHVYNGSYNSTASSAIGNQAYFTGRTFDEEIEKYNYRFRNYNPEIGRFVQYDPMEFIDGMNMYAYVKNNPENKKDPSGMNPALLLPAAPVAPVVSGAAICVAGAATGLALAYIGASAIYGQDFVNDAISSSASSVSSEIKNALDDLSLPPSIPKPIDLPEETTEDDPTVPDNTRTGPGVPPVTLPDNWNDKRIKEGEKWRKREAEGWKDPSEYPKQPTPSSPSESTIEDFDF